MNIFIILIRVWYKTTLLVCTSLFPAELNFLCIICFIIASLEARKVQQNLKLYICTFNVTSMNIALHTGEFLLFFFVVVVGERVRIFSTLDIFQYSFYPWTIILLFNIFQMVPSLSYYFTKFCIMKTAGLSVCPYAIFKLVDTLAKGNMRL